MKHFAICKKNANLWNFLKFDICLVSAQAAQRIDQLLRFQFAQQIHQCVSVCSTVQYHNMLPELMFANNCINHTDLRITCMTFRHMLHLSNYKTQSFFSNERPERTDEKYYEIVSGENIDINSPICFQKLMKIL